MNNCPRYLLNNTAYLKYHDYLKAGLPIPTGVIEGACRHLIKRHLQELQSNSWRCLISLHIFSLEGILLFYCSWDFGACLALQNR
ncbi:hypothetical protein [Moorena sp. SIO3H5]|uniref:hypothetical protein n=1 Tax=Moorena sp. SIO3H5 TaxID=2607834 RepID=UPI0013B9247E|nr:hypothetical protein [Moorena sp. SIO3H5]NEO68989.1 hypothetical protein [Moorena sp. SIO3H5]